MKPAFALNLSPDGISLLHRTSRGWLLVGAVALDDPDVPAALGYLRKTALGLAPRGFATKLILPASQILYTAVEAPGPDAANRRRQIARALEGRTPYAAEDLVFDWSGTGGRVNVAVVARETLEEAEAFAQEHRFNPVSFVAMPEDGSFAGEPFFGQTAKARSYIPEGERLVRDQDPVRIAGDADLSRLVAASVAEVMADEVAEAVGETAQDAVLAAEVAQAGDEDIVTTALAAPEMPGDDAAEVAVDAAAEETDAGSAGPAFAEPAEDSTADASEALPADATDLGEESVVEAPLAEPAGEPSADAMPELPLAPEALETPSEASDTAPEAPGAGTDARAERRRARAERRDREAAAQAEADAAAALARQASFGFVASAPDEPEALATENAPSAEGDFGGADETSVEAPLAEQEAEVEAPVQDEPEADIANDPAAADESDEAPFLAVEDEAEDAGEPAPPRPEIDADGVLTPFAAAATLSPAMPGPRLRLGAAAAEPGRASPAKPLAGGAGSVISPRLGIAADPRPEPKPDPASRTRARASGLGKAVIAAGKMAKAAKTARGTSRRVDVTPGPAAPRVRTGSEAEALTVFGARRAAPVRGKPRYMGLILTAVLVFLMLAVALWSSLLDGTPTAEAPASEPLAAAPIRTTAVEALAETPAFEDVPTVDAIEADAMTEAEIAADGGLEAMEMPEGTADDMAEAPTDLPVDLPEDVPPELADGPAEDGLAANTLAEQLAEDLAATPEEAPVSGNAAAPDAAAAAAIAAAGVGAAGDLANGLAAADIATAAPDVPAAVAGGPVPDAEEGLPPRPADPAVTTRSAEGLPETATLTADALPAPPQPPLPYGTGFQFGENGLIVATPDGALTPEGVTVVEGAPARVPPTRPAAVVEAAAEADAPQEAAAEPEGSVPDPALEGRKPLPRPATLEVPAEAAPEATPAADPGDGAALSVPLAADPALAPFKPRAASTVAVAAAAAARSAEEARAAEMAALQAELASATPSAVTSSRKPLSRPQDFSQGIEAALAMAATTAPVVAAAAPPPQAAPAPVAPAAAPTRQAAVAPAPEPEEMDEPEPIAAAPSIPTTASVAKQATISGAISLREINLIGVYGASSSRRALVRLSNGRMLRVKIGDRIDGGQVTAIGEGQLTYVKGGRTHVLRMLQQS
ncbi:hypothetical protein [Frigidibacter sp.]|uniref:hypothetical protein n=1 Tax=Frigidibacter sp. TaxID=2586418 RepID=UPI0027374B6B|nr:hypothetical protein [Frigidibacter sp.]MDP3340863.1 hypothetical protein [Frigidibacter sp.]